MVPRDYDLFPSHATHFFLVFQDKHKNTQTLVMYNYEVIYNIYKIIYGY